MCLSTKSKKKPPKTGFMYKIFTRSDNGKQLFNSVIDTDVPVRRGRWLKAHRDPKLLTKWKYSKVVFRYPTGFHGYVTKSAAEKSAYSPSSTIKKVEYRGGHTLGTQNCFKVIVADRIKIPKD